MITWAEFIRNQYETNMNLQSTNIKCPKCGAQIFRDNSEMLTSNPPKYKYICLTCEWNGYA